MTATERCWRCGAEMEWRHGTWQCPSCRFKLGCCEGEPQSPSGCLATEEPIADPGVASSLRE